jgi:methyl-accepting chemotaxis protein
MTIKQRLILGFATMACVPVLIVATWMIAQQRSQSVENFRISNEREVSHVENAMQLFFDGITRNVDYIAGQEVIKSAGGKLKSYMSAAPEIEPASPIGQSIARQFTEMGKAHPAYAFITYADKEGGVSFWPDYALKNYDPRPRPWYKAAIERPGITFRTQAYEWKEGNVALISTVRTVQDPNGKVVGVIDVDVSLKQLTDLAKKIKFGDSGYLILIEKGGVVLADASDPANAFKRVADLGAGFSDLETLPVGLATLELNGSRYFVNISESQELGWRFVSLIKEAEVMASSWKVAGQIAFVALLLVVGFAALGATLAGRIVKPIQGVADGLESIASGEGDLTNELRHSGNDETAVLAKWFNQFLGTIRHFVQRTRGASSSLEETSLLVTKLAEDMQESAQRQRQSLELVSTAFNEMVATAGEVARSCASAADSADVSQRQVGDGKVQIGNAALSVGQLSESLEHSAAALTELEKDSHNINTILDTIRSIADQTNLLALNAAIEAARAGEQGRGFSVVADEVRALAKRTADSTGEIGNLLGCLLQRSSQVAGQMRTSLTLSEQSVSSINEARASFDGIQASVDEIRDKNAQIATAAEEQHQVSEDINRHITEVFEDARRVVDLAQTSHLQTNELERLSNELKQLVARYRT